MKILYMTNLDKNSFKHLIILIKSAKFIQEYAIYIFTVFLETLK